MPSLRGHMVFVSLMRDALQTELPALGQIVETHWPAALVGSEGPDGWFFTEGATRPDTHLLDVTDPSTWPGAMDRWLEQHAELRPGRSQPPETAAFVAGYLSHLGLDTWGEQYQHPDLPSDARSAAPSKWYPPVLAERARVRAALRRLGEAPFPPDRLVSKEALSGVNAPARFHPDAVRRVAVGILPSLALTDPWEISRVNPLREMADTPQARNAWDLDRSGQRGATETEYDALVEAAMAFTLDVVRKWW
ncbi:MAG TPA: hypothetical protein VNM48_02620 [Chloroflexota bacterium]|nr:hypothetical protein [Chloroflexota bacterium]